MSLPDTVFIFVLALIIFGPKKLPEIGRQIGKLVGEFRRASNEFKFQIEEELRNVDIIEKPATRNTIAASNTTTAESPSTSTLSEASSDPAVDLPVGQHPNIDSLNTGELNASGMDLSGPDNSGMETANAELATIPTITPAEGVEARTTAPYAATSIEQPAAIENSASLPEAHASDNSHSVPAEAEITHG